MSSREHFELKNISKKFKMRQRIANFQTICIKILRGPIFQNKTPPTAAKTSHSEQRTVVSAGQSERYCF